MTDAEQPFESRPATEGEIADVLADNGVASLDDMPAGTPEFNGYGELITELERSIAAADAESGSS